MKTKKWPVVLLVLLVLAGSIFIWWKQPNSLIKKKVTNQVKKFEPKVTVASMNITDIDEDKITANASLSILNNLPVTINAQRLKYVIYIDSGKVIEDTYARPISIKGNDTTRPHLPLVLHFKKLGSVLKRIENAHKDSALYTVKSSFTVDVPIAGQREFNVEFSKRLPAVHVPKTTIKDIDIGKLGFKTSTLDIVANVQNPNVFPIKMKDGKYKVTIDNDKNVMEGQMQKVVNIPAKGSAPVAMKVDMKTMKFPKLGWKMLFDRKDTRFNMTFNCTMVSDNNIFKNSKMAFKANGTLEELTDAVKKNH